MGLSLPATSEKLKRLEESGIISGYSATIFPEAIGYKVMTIIGMTTMQPNKNRLMEELNTMPEVIECLHVTGQDSYLLRVVTRDLLHLEVLINMVNPVPLLCCHTLFECAPYSLYRQRKKI